MLSIHLHFLSMFKTLNFVQNKVYKEEKYFFRMNLFIFINYLICLLQRFNTSGIVGLKM